MIYENFRSGSNLNSRSSGEPFQAMVARLHLVRTLKTLVFCGSSGKSRNKASLLKATYGKE